MESGFSLPRNSDKNVRKQSGAGDPGMPARGKRDSGNQFTARAQSGSDSGGHPAQAAVARGASHLGQGSAQLVGFPAGVRECAAPGQGLYDARRLRSQRDVIRDVMLAAANCDTWLTLGEIRALTRYGEVSISAQLRHLRKTENGGYEVVKRHREGVTPAHPGADGRGEFVWEYRVSRILCANQAVLSGAADLQG